MKFVAHNHYNNNSSGVGSDLESPPSAFSVTESPVRISTQGVVIFNLRREHSPEEKADLFRELDQRLKAEFGQGFALATSSDSDCAIPRELQAFYKAVKEANPDTKTLWSGPHRKPEGADIYTRHDVTMGELVTLTGATAADKAEPEEGWRDFDWRLEDMYDEAVEAVEARAEQRAAAAAEAATPDGPKTEPAKRQGLGQ